MGSGSIMGDQGPSRMRIHGTIGSSNLQEHKVPAVIELNREPIPAGLVRVEKAAAELVVHPCKSGNFIRMTTRLDSARSMKSGKRIVVGSISLQSRLLADSAFVMYYLGFLWGKSQFNARSPARAARTCSPP